jgi:hypothetical protein
MDDAKIDLIAREVLTSLKKARSPETPAVTREGPAVRAVAVGLSLHPSLQLLSVPGGIVGSPCVIEPDKPCIGSLRCRTFGH